MPGRGHPFATSRIHPQAPPHRGLHRMDDGPPKRRRLDDDDDAEGEGEGPVRFHVTVGGGDRGDRRSDRSEGSAPRGRDDDEDDDDRRDGRRDGRAGDDDRRDRRRRSAQDRHPWRDWVAFF